VVKEEKGLDTSNMAGNTRCNWEDVRDAGYSFVVFRASGWDNGPFTDRTFLREYDRAKSVGLVTGAYCIPNLAHAVGPQIAEYCKSVRLGPGDLPPVLDIEGIRRNNIHPAVAVERMRECADRLRQYFGVEFMLYSSARLFREELLDHPDVRHLQGCWLWMVWWRKSSPDGIYPTPRVIAGLGEDRDWDMHQTTGTTRGIPGLNGAVDRNRWHTMRHGAAGDRVAKVQRRLGVAEDGLFGRQSADALALFQIHRGLAPTGELDVTTFARLAWVKDPKPPSVL
jgi:lysozyme